MRSTRKPGSAVRYVTPAVIALFLGSTHIVAGMDGGRPLDSDGSKKNTSDECLQRSDEQICQEEAELALSVQAQIDSAALKAAPVAFACKESARPLSMTYYTALEPPAAVITYGDDQAIIFLQRTGSGARYARTGIEFWEHHGSASVDFYGIKLRCSPVP